MSWSKGDKESRRDAYQVVRSVFFEWDGEFWVVEAYGPNWVKFGRSGDPDVYCVGRAKPGDAWHFAADARDATASNWLPSHKINAPIGILAFFRANGSPEGRGRL